MIISSLVTNLKRFAELTSQFTELDLPMNPDKRTPPTRALTRLGINIDIAYNTLSINHMKLQAIHEECTVVYNKTLLVYTQMCTSCKEFC